MCVLFGLLELERIIREREIILLEGRRWRDQLTLIHLLLFRSVCGRFFG